MTTTDPKGAVSKPKLRWYQFSLRTLFGITLHVAICCSILATGLSWREYRAYVGVRTRCGYVTTPRDWRLLVAASVVRAQIGYEIACTPAVMASAARQLRQEGVVRIDGEETSRDSLAKRLTISDHGTNYEIIWITACSRNPDNSRKLVTALCDAWLTAIPEILPSLEPRFLELVRQRLSQSEWEEFERNYRAGKRGYSLGLSGSLASYGISILPSCDAVVLPHKAAAIWVASVWGALGTFAIAYARLRWDQ